jgi:type VI secretion system secreted protein VgrG
VRVASNWAGNGPGHQTQCGTLGLPRIGSEVLVAFLGGDPDKPVIVGQLYNQHGVPPAFSALDGLPGNRYLSGIKSREIKGGRNNRLRLDDTAGQISAQLASDHARSELNLGFLTQDRERGHGNQRGDGAELTTDEYLALRAGEGILVSAWHRLNGRSKQLDRAEYLGLIDDCVELFRSLGKYAAKHQGMPVDDKKQSDLQDAAKRWGQESGTPSGETGSAFIGVTSPDGISFATSKAIVSYAAANLDTVAGDHLQMTAGQRINLNAGKGISLFSQSGGLNAIAHFGKFLLQSQHDDTRIDSAKDMKVTARKRMIIMAEEIVFVNTGGAYISLKGGNLELGGPGSMTVKTDGHYWNGPASEMAELPTFGEGDFGRTPRLLRASDGEPVPDVTFCIEKGDGAVLTGHTDQVGETPKITGNNVQRFVASFYGRRS